MLQEYLQKLKDITNKAEDIAKSNKLAAIDLSLNESITTIKLKVNEIINAINEGKLKGEDGAPGVDGVDGQDGKDFTYEDFTPEQLENLRGPQGYRGEKGEKGDKGETGETGPIGPQGIQGETGPQGIQGETGPIGPQGIDGKQVELQRTTTHIQWRYTDEEWKDLISIDELRAPALQNIDAYTKEETDTLIADAIAQALENVGIMLEDYATKEYVNEQINALNIISNKAITNTEVRPEFINFEENPDAIDRIKLIDYDGNSVVLEIFTTSKFGFYSNYADDKTRLYWSNNAYTSNVKHYKYVDGQWVVQNKASGIVHINVYTKKPINDYIVESTIEILTDKSNEDGFLYKKEMIKELIADYNLATDSPFYTINHTDAVENAPADNIKGCLKVERVGEYDIIQTVYDTKGLKTYTRLKTENAWSEWIECATKNDVDTVKNDVSAMQNTLEEMQTSFADKINNYDYLNADGMTESYNWIDINGFKVMWVDVKLSESEYNSGSAGLMMKTLNIPGQAQIFNKIMMANITSYCRESNNTLSRVVQNAEIISTTSLRGRWRHTDNTYPRIDKFTIMCFGF